MQSRLASLRVAPFERNVAFLKSYAGQAYKLTRCNCVRTKGVELSKGIYVEKGTRNAQGKQRHSGKHCGIRRVSERRTFQQGVQENV